MKKKHHVLLITSIIAILMLGGIAAFLLIGTAGLKLSIIGEEGYQVYAPGVVSGQFDPLKFERGPDAWSSRNHARTSAGGNITFTTSLSGSYGCSARSAGQVMPIQPGNGYVVATGNTYVTIKDLYLNNFKSDVYLGYANICYDGDNLKGRLNSCISSNRGWKYCNPIPSTYSAPVQPEMGNVEVRWDDYNTGHYQLFWRGAKVEEGFANETNPLKLTINGYFSKPCDFGCSGSSGAYFYNMRYQKVFGCDPKDDEYVVSKIFANGDDFNLANLRGFKRFCTQIPAIHMKDGVAGTSKQVYYALALGKTVPVGNNEIYKVFYVGNGSLLGIPPNTCVGSAYDYSTKNCSSLTGIVDICPSGYSFSNGMCVVQVENKIDYEESKLLGANSAKITLNRRDTRAYNGNNAFLSAAHPTFTGVASNYECKVNYPSRRDGWNILLNNVKFTEGETKLINPFFKLKLERVEASVYTECGDDMGDGQYAYTAVEYVCSSSKNGEIETIIATNEGQVRTIYETSDLALCTPYNTTRYSDVPTEDAYQWQEVYTLERIKPLAAISAAPLPQYDVVRGGNIDVKINNEYGAFYGTIAVVYEEPMGDRTFHFKNMQIPAGTSTVSIPAKTPSLGTVRATVAILMPIKSFSIMASDGVSFEYQVANEQGQTIDELNRKVENLTSIIVNKEMTIQEISAYVDGLKLSTDEQAAIITNLRNDGEISKAEMETLVKELGETDAERAALRDSINDLQAAQSPSLWQRFLNWVTGVFER